MGNLILKYDGSFFAFFVRFKWLQVKAMLWTGFLTDAANIASVFSEEELIGIPFTVVQNSQSLCRTINGAKAATRASLFINEEYCMILEPEDLQKGSSAHPVFRS